MTDSDWESIKAALLEENEPAVARRKYARLLNLLSSVFPLDATSIKEESAIDWDQRKQQAISCIREAATNLADPSKAGAKPVLADHWEEISQEERSKLGYPVSFDLSDPEILRRCVEFGFVSYALDQIASAMSAIPGNKFRRVQAHDLLNINPRNIGQRGGTPENPNKARTRALLVKELDDVVPTNIKGRYALIARLAQYRDPKITPHYVRSTLKRGRT